MRKRVTIDNIVHTLELYGWEDKKALVCIDDYKFRNLKMYFRHERTLDDHMGNTECRYFVKAPFPGGKTRRVYIEDLM